MKSTGSLVACKLPLIATSPASNATPRILTNAPPATLFTTMLSCTKTSATKNVLKAPILNISSANFVTKNARPAPRLQEFSAPAAIARGRFTNTLSVTLAVPLVTLEITVMPTCQSASHACTPANPVMVLQALASHVTNKVLTSINSAPRVLHNVQLVTYHLLAIPQMSVNHAMAA